jgi:bifunctional polynucleotide phosphatase/kinase
MSAKWEEAYSGRLLIMTYGDCKPRSKIAGFDMDGTLIATKSGKVFAVDKHDWKLLFDQVTSKVLQKLNDEDKFKIVLMTNQAGIGIGKVKIADFKDKVEAIAKALKVPLQVK